MCGSLAPRTPCQRLCVPEAKRCTIFAASEIERCKSDVETGLAFKYRTWLSALAGAGPQGAARVLLGSSSHSSIRTAGITRFGR